MKVVFSLKNLINEKLLLRINYHLYKLFILYNK